MQAAVKKSGITPATLGALRRLVWKNFRAHGRDFVWRRNITPYRIVVSEIMLQQTQTDRVAKKFPEFVALFPNWKKLAAASPSAVIKAWQGLGYNRRALALHRIAQLVCHEHHGRLPRDPKILTTFPGIGPNTAGSILAFAYNQPVVFIETNIRSVFIHLLFLDTLAVTDEQILPLVASTLDETSPRDWYYGLMDLGVVLKKHFGNPNRRSASYRRQTKFTGSNRQLRGEIVRQLSQKSSQRADALVAVLTATWPPHAIRTALAQLAKEGFIVEKNGLMRLS